MRAVTTHVNIFVAILTLGPFSLPSPADTAYYVAPTGSDSNPGTIVAPFATFRKAQSAMRASSIKTTYVRAGKYFPTGFDTGGGDTAIVKLTSADSGETWSYYPFDGVASAIIDGGSNSTTIGIKWGFWLEGVSNVTINGLQLQHFANEFLHATGSASGTMFINNTLHDNYNWRNYAGIALWGSAQNSTVANNHVYNTVTHGILASTCSGSCAAGIKGVIIKNNFVYNTCTISTDCGAIYLQDYASPRSTNITISNNFIRDVNPKGDNGGRGIYLDDGTSNVMATGNIVSGHKNTCFNIHGGDNDIFSGNICDEQSSGHESIVRYETSSEVPSSLMTGNAFTNNIIIAGSRDGGNGYTGDGVPNPLTIKDNAYFNYVGLTIDSTGGSAGTDINPISEDPHLSTWCYAIEAGSPVYNGPVFFPGVVGGWGQPGFVIPSIGTPPSSPHITGCGSRALVPTLPYRPGIE